MYDEDGSYTNCCNSLLLYPVLQSKICIDAYSSDPNGCKHRAFTVWILIVDLLTGEGMNLKLDIDLELLEESQFELIIGLNPVIQYAPLVHVRQLVFVNEVNDNNPLDLLKSHF